MSWDIIELFFTLLESIIKVYFFTNFFGFKRHVKRRKLIFISAILIEMAIVSMMNASMLFDGLIGGAVYFAVAFIYCLVFLNGTAIMKIIMCCFCEVYLAIVSFTTLGLLSLWSEKDFVRLITEQEEWRLIALIVTKTLFLFAVIVVLRLKKKREFYFSKYEWLIMISTFVCSLVLILSAFEMTLHLSIVGQTSTFLLTTIGGLLVINASAITLTGKIAKSNEEKIKMDMLNLQLEQQTQSILEINDKYNAMTKIRHDIKGCLNCAAVLIDEGQYNDAKLYLTEIAESKLPQVNPFVTTDSLVVNALLNYKLAVCQDKQIEVKCSIIGNMSDFPELDMSMLLSNVLDNAIEACTNVKNPKVTIDIYDKKNYKIMVISNSIPGSVLEHNPNLVTSKANKTKHGIGLYSMRDIVRKYEGTIDFFEEGNKFVCSIMLLNKTKNIKKELHKTT